MIVLNIRQDILPPSLVSSVAFGMFDEKILAKSGLTRKDIDLVVGVIQEQFPKGAPVWVVTAAAAGIISRIIASSVADE